MPTPRRKRILHELRIDKIAAVDRPAQVHARAVLAKRADDEEDHDMQIQKLVSFDLFDDAVAHLAKAESIPRHQAMAKARIAFPSLCAKFESEGEECIAKAAEANKPVAISKSEAAWNNSVDAIVERDGCPRHQAMAKAHEESPQLFAAAFREARVEKAVNLEQVQDAGPAMRAFEEAVQMYMRRSGLSRSAAMAWSPRPAGASGCHALHGAVTKKEPQTMTQLTSHELAAASRQMESTRDPLPADPPARFDRRITHLMNATGRDRTWARARCAELWPAEHEAFIAAKA